MKLLLVLKCWDNLKFIGNATWKTFFNFKKRDACWNEKFKAEVF